MSPSDKANLMVPSPAAVRCTERTPAPFDDDLEGAPALLFAYLALEPGGARLERVALGNSPSYRLFLFTKGADAREPGPRVATQTQREFLGAALLGMVLPGAILARGVTFGSIAAVLLPLGGARSRLGVVRTGYRAARARHSVAGVSRPCHGPVSSVAFRLRIGGVRPPTCLPGPPQAAASTASATTRRSNETLTLLATGPRRPLRGSTG